MGSAAGSAGVGALLAAGLTSPGAGLRRLSSIPVPASNARVEDSGIDLIRRMAARDRDGLAAFYDRYAGLVYPLVLRIVRDPADAADVLQEVFWEAWQTAAAYDAARGTPEAWLLVRARSRAIDRTRAARRRADRIGAPLEEGTARTAASADPDPASRAADRGVVRGALAVLPPAEREVIELAYYAGLTQSEIAAYLKQPLGTVKTRTRSGLDRLRETLERPEP